MKSTSILLLVSLPLSLTACLEDGPIDLSDLLGGWHGPSEPSDPGDPTDPPGSGGAGGGTDPGELTPAVAMTRAQRDALAEEYWAQVERETGSVTSTGTGGSVELDPNDLMVEISDVGVACNVFAPSLPCGGHWRMGFTLPAAYQQVGVYDLNDFALGVSVFETGAPYAPQPGACPMGGGSFISPGTLEILAIDDVEVRFRLTTADLFFEGGNPSGEYTAPRCP